MPDSSPELIIQALLEAGQLGGHVSYIWEWSSGDRGYSDAKALADAAHALGFSVTLQLSPTAIGAPVVPPDLTGTSFRDEEIRARYLADVERLAALEPDYLVLAAEINLLFQENPREFDAFESLFHEGYKRAKQISPKTKVGVSHHMDMLFAFPQLSILERLQPQDFIGLTSYPNWLVSEGLYKSVADIPLWYYKRLRLLIAKPILFTELAWPSGGRSNLDMQHEFIARLPELMKGVNPEQITWALQHDVKHFQPRWLNEKQVAILLNYKVDAEVLFEELNTMGLLSWDGPPKPSWFKALEYPENTK